MGPLSINSSIHKLGHIRKIDISAKWGGHEGSSLGNECTGTVLHTSDGSGGVYWDRICPWMLHEI